MFKKNFILTILFLTTFSIFSQNNKFSALTIPQELKENANSVIRFEDFYIDMTTQREMTITMKKAVTVFNKFANREADITLLFDKRRIVKSVNAYYFDEFGKEIKRVKKKDFKDYSASDGFSLYNDGRYLHYSYTPINYPYTVYYEYEIKTSNTAFISQWFPIKGFYQSVQKSKYTFKYPLNVKLLKSEKKFDGYDITISEETGKTIYNTKSVRAIVREPNAPSFSSFVPNARFGVNNFNLEGVDGKANNWQEFGKWRFDNLNNGNEIPTDKIRHTAKKIVGNETDKVKKARLIYEYLQSKVRYISIQEGIGGWKPMNASKVDELSYGDCKALTNYTKTLLKAVDVESNYTVLWAGNTKKDVDKDVFSMQGNHVILNIPHDEGDIWLECTSQNTPFGEIAGFTDDRDVLVITPNGGEIRHTRIYDEKENLQTIKANYKLDNQGNISAQVYVEMMGRQFKKHLKYEQGSPKELEELFKNVWDNINNMDIKSASINNNKDGGKFEEKVTFTAENYGVISGDRMIFPINAFNVSERAPKRVRDRKLPVDISFGYFDVDEVIIDLPTDYSIEVISDNVNLETDFGTYKSTITKISDSQLSYKREFLLKNGKYPKEAYKEYRDFRKKVVKADNSKVVLIKK